MRPNKTRYYLDIAKTVSERATCLRRRYGAIIVKNDEIIATGFNGAPRGRENCSDIGDCRRERLQIPSGERYELCRAVHSEANCIISASRRDCEDAQMYLCCVNPKDSAVLDCEPCSMCKRLIINAGIHSVIVDQPDGSYKKFDVADFIERDESLGDHRGY